MNINAEYLLRYDLWANREILAALQNGSPPDRALRIFAHIVAVHELFLARVTGGGPVVVWPEPDLARADEALGRAHDRWLELLRTRPADSQYEYLNSQGRRWQSRLIDIVTHVVIHSAYHRGQIALLLGGAGQTPPLTDFIQAARAGLI